MALKKTTTKQTKRVDSVPDMERRWQVESAADTLLRAGAIQQDKTLMADVKKELQKRKKAIEKVTKR